MDDHQSVEQTLAIHGRHVSFDHHSREGFHYLGQRLNVREARVFFDQARLRGSAEFEDHVGRRYELSYDNGKFFVKKLT